MGSIFRYDSKFGQIAGKIADCAALSILWAVFCLPVFTAGAATTALYYTAVKVLRKDSGSGVAKEFLSSFKSNFKQSTLVLFLAFLLCIVWGLVCISVYENSGSSLLIAYIVYFTMLAFGIMWLHYVFSYIARFQDKLSTILKNSLYICLSNFPYSLLVITFFAIVVFFTAIHLPVSLWSLLVIPAVYTVLISLILEPIYQKYLPPAENHGDA